MVNDLLYFILRASISASLSDREAFIEKVSAIMEQKMNQDPEAARQLSHQIAGAMEGLSGTLLLQQLFAPKRDKQLNQSLDKLSEVIEKLNALLEEANLHGASSQNDPL